MNINDFKGTLYDILGYFAPGLLTLIVSLLTYIRIQNPRRILFVLKSIVDSISGFEIFILIISAYIVGHLVSSISFAIIESFIKRIKKLNNYISIKVLSDEVHYNNLCKKYKTEFKANYNDKNFRKIICHVQSKQSQIYGTALIFLSFYGMARSFASIFLFLSIIEVLLLLFIKAKGSLFLLFVFIFLFIVFCYEYIRFMKYYKETIVSGFLIND